MDNHAVSPVIGTILMVAIAVVLSAVVFLIVRAMADSDGDNVPAIGFVENEEQDTTSVPITQLQADWQYITATSNVPARMAFNAQAGAGSTPMSPGVAVQVSSVHKVVSGADYIDFCADGLVPVPAAITLAYDDHAGANQLLRELEFKLLAPCQ